MAADPTDAPTGEAGTTTLSERRFRVMGSDAHVVVDADPDRLDPARLLDMALRRLVELEARWSRFLPTSEVSRLNAAGGDLTVVSADTYRLISLGVDAWASTSGRFDPTVLGDVIRAGYDRSFEQIPELRPRAPMSGLRQGAAGIVLLPSACAVALPYGTGFDPGGIGKGLAADLVADELIAAGAAGACVNVGGDLTVAGTRAGDSRWVIAVDPADDGDLVATVSLGAGAVATTTSRRRAWAIADRGAHHVIDPATGAPSESGLSSVTVIAGECWRAETLAKAAFVAGAGEALSVIDQAGAAALLVDEDGTVRHSAHLADYLTTAPQLIAAGADEGILQ